MYREGCRRVSAAFVLLRREMQKQKRLGLNSELYCSPIFFGLSGRVEFECISDVVAKNAIKMRGHDLEAAFLSPIDYGRESSDYCIIPNVAVSSGTPTNSIVLHFKKGLRTVNTIAVHPTSTSEIVLASILLSERFDVRPKIVPAIGSFDQMLRSADAVLLVGNDALAQAQGHQARLDLVEEWIDMTDLPYVHGFWCVRETELAKDDVAVIQLACESGIKSLEEIVQAEAAKQFCCPPEILKQYLEAFSFTFTDQEQESVTEFLRYAYYHGILPDVADLNFYPGMDTEDNLPLLDPSLN
jgi:chorismate dehydratase